MLELINITKIYGSGENAVQALKGVSIKFRKSEFVSVLGPSGCGKTTMLNIVGGLDRYTMGDLLIRGKSTTLFRAHDWDAYRNNCVGFVFQNYNLIPHQSVLGNVELALTLSGISKVERKRMAEVALDKVGLSDQKHKRPNQLSGGQMQRVAIARALVNNPDIILADEPTGALDSTTSQQVIDLLKEISKDRLVIMVTHNNELAERYSTRIIKLLDGNVESDSNPLSNEEQWEIYNENQAVLQAEERACTKAERKEKKAKLKKTSMSFFTALNLSLRNLLTKKGRTTLVSFAGSIGIIGIALVLAISNGFKIYINRIETETLANFPVSIARLGIDLNALQTPPEELLNRPEEYPEDGKSVGFYEEKSVMELIGKPNNITKAFVEYIEEFKTMKSESSNYRGQTLALDVQKSYAIRMPLITKYDKSLSGDVKFVRSSSSNSNPLSNIVGGSSSYFSEMLDNPEFVQKQYDVIYGNYPSAYNEIALVVDSTNRISKSLARSLGFDEELESLDFDKVLDKSYKIILNDLYYSIDGSTGEVTAMETGSVSALKEIFGKKAGEGVIELKITGIMRANKDAVMSLYNTGLVYLPSLTQEYLKSCKDAPIADLQQSAMDVSESGTAQIYKAIFSETELLESFTAAINFYERMMGVILEIAPGYAGLTIQAQKAMAKSIFGASGDYEGMDAQTLDELVTMFVHLGDAIEQFYDEDATSFGLPLFYFKEFFSNGFVSVDSVKQSAMQKLGVGGLPTSIYIYPRSFETKTEILAKLDEWNKAHPDNVITATDPAAMLSSTMGQMIDIISYVLAAFAGVSLVVSSIMIGIITYVSVIERTKEIGVLRSIGARKKDIGRVFNAETIIIGFVAGLMGVLIAYLLCIPINAIISALAGSAMDNMAVLNPLHGLILIAISMLLTLISGLLPSSIASRRDPVAALRSE